MEGGREETPPGLPGVGAVPLPGATGAERGGIQASLPSPTLLSRAHAHSLGSRGPELSRSHTWRAPVLPGAWPQWGLFPASGWLD